MAQSNDGIGAILNKGFTISIDYVRDGASSRSPEPAAGMTWTDRTDVTGNGFGMTGAYNLEAHADGLQMVFGPVVGTRYTRYQVSTGPAIEMTYAWDTNERGEKVLREDGYELTRMGGNRTLAATDVLAGWRVGVRESSLEFSLDVGGMMRMTADDTLPAGYGGMDFRLLGPVFDNGGTVPGRIGMGVGAHFLVFGGNPVGGRSQDNLLFETSASVLYTY